VAIKSDPVGLASRPFYIPPMERYSAAERSPRQADGKRLNEVPVGEAPQPTEFMVEYAPTFGVLGRTVRLG